MIYFESLKLSSFRNFDDEIIPFSPGTNVILGQNGHGKSNLLEALYLICTGKSFRTSHLKELIQFEAPGFFLEAHLQKGAIKHHVMIEFYPHKKKITIDNTHFSHLHALMGFVPVVVMTPEMKKIIDEGPLERRKFIDFLASQLSRPYFESITRYHKALKQRNAALKAQQNTLVWEKIMAKEWLFIEKTRQELTLDLLKNAQGHMRSSPQISADLEIRYISSLKDQKEPLSENLLLSLYQKSKPQELHAGTTLYGPHRDDLEIKLGGSLAHVSASEGQKKMIIAAMCLASADLLQQTLGIAPLFLIDDYDAHFDQVRKKWVYAQLEELPQAFLTSPLHDLAETQDAILIEQGKLQTSDCLHSLKI